MLIPFGILSSAGSLAEGDFELIETQVLASAAPSVTFTGLDTYHLRYKHLQIRMVSRHNSSAGNAIRLQFNSDTGNNYARHFLQGDGASVASGATSTTNSLAVGQSGGTSTANVFGASVVDILDFASTSKNTTVRGLMGSTVSGDNNIALRSGVYLSTNAISSILLDQFSTQNILTGSRFSLYGIKG